MYVYFNFYCSPAKKHFSDPHFFRLETPLIEKGCEAYVVFDTNIRNGNYAMLPDSTIPNSSSHHFLHTPMPKFHFHLKF